MADAWVALTEIYGPRVQSFKDLYDLSNSHRADHGEAICSVYPNRPSKAPIWGFLAVVIGARKFLEVGCGVGYTAALMAEAAGPDGHVDAIERDPVHTRIARRELARRGLASRVNVIEGDAARVLEGLGEPYDVVHVDAETHQYMAWLPDLARLVKVNGMIVTSNVASLIGDWEHMRSDAPIKQYMRALMADQRFTTCLFEGTVALSYRRA